MAVDHEYSVIGHKRTRIAFWLAFLSGGIAGGLSVLAGLGVEHLKAVGAHNIPDLILWPVTGSAVFGIIFLIFDAVFWKIPIVSRIVGVPNVSGSWDVEGQSYDATEEPTFAWQARIEITQKYQKISIHLRTGSSESHSVTAAVIPEGRAGYRLIYSYRNAPKPGEPELNPHMGHCELSFSTNLETAEGHYFNSGGRFTHGTMKLKRI